MSFFDVYTGNAREAMDFLTAKCQYTGHELSGNDRKIMNECLDKINREASKPAHMGGILQLVGSGPTCWNAGWRQENANKIICWSCGRRHV